jgi:hypothetical protein
MEPMSDQMLEWYCPELTAQPAEQGVSAEILRERLTDLFVRDLISPQEQLALLRSLEDSAASGSLERRSSLIESDLAAACDEAKRVVLAVVKAHLP